MGVWVWLSHADVEGGKERVLKWKETRNLYRKAKIVNHDILFEAIIQSNQIREEYQLFTFLVTNTTC